MLSKKIIININDKGGVNMIINDKLSHLSEDQIREIIYKYEETKMKIRT